MMTIQQQNERRRFDAELERNGCITVSNGSMRSQDLLPKFLDALRVVAPEVHQQLTMLDCGFSAIPEDEEDEWWDSEECAYLLNETLFDVLNEHAPHGYYFGSHKGNWSCFGYWPIEENE